MTVETLVERESTILERIVVTPESAQGILGLRFSKEDEDRMRELMDRNNRGAIAQQERAEMETYRRIGSLLGILQARARLLLANEKAR